MWKKIGVLLAILASGIDGAALAAEHHHHDHGETQSLRLNGGKKWATDASLRQAMGNINRGMADALPRIHRNQFSDEAYGQLAKAVEKEIAYAVAHCKLDPKADAMLHLIIAELAAGAEAMASGGKPSRHDGAARVMQALKNYGRYFDHPGWLLPRG